MTATAADRPGATLAMFTIDCADPQGEARFWAEALGWEVTYSDENYGMVTHEGQRLGFGRIEGWQPPKWPDTGGAKQFHLDLAVADLGEAERHLVSLGATKPEEQPSDDWVVLRDPDGHLFCLTLAQNWG